MKKLTALELAMRQPLEYNYDNKERFRREGLKVMRALAKELGLLPAEYDLRFCAGGTAVSGDVVLHGEHVYVHLSKFWEGREVYYRTCEGRKDYVGGRNHTCSVAELVDLPAMAGRIRRLLRLLGEVER